MSVKLLTKHHLEFLCSIGGCTGSYESTLVKMPHCWKSHVTAHLISEFYVGIKTLLNQGLSEPEIYADLVYTFKK